MIMFAFLQLPFFNKSKHLIKLRDVTAVDGIVGIFDFAIVINDEQCRKLLHLALIGSLAIVSFLAAAIFMLKIALSSSAFGILFSLVAAARTSNAL